MVLKRKIFSSLLLPYLFIVAIVFGLALFALKKEIAVAQKETSQLIAKEEEEKKKDLALLFGEEISFFQREMKSLLQFTSEQDKIDDPLSFLVAIGSVQSVDLAQITQGEKSYSYLPKKVIAHPIQEMASFDEETMVEMDKRLYVALPLGQGTALLFDLNRLSADEKALLQKEAKEKKEYEKKEPLAALLPFIVDGFRVGEKRIFPSGILVSNEKGNFGYVAEEFFSCRGLKNESKTACDSDNNLYLIDSQKISDQLTLTLGFSLDERVKALALFTKETVFFTLPDKTMVGYCGSGKRCDGSLLFSDQKIDRMDMPLADKGTLTFFTDKTEKEKPLLPFMQLSDALFHALVMALLIAAAFSLLFALLLFWYLSGRVLKPLDILASAQAKVAEGKFEEKEISEVAKRKDAIGRLATTFLAMVESLKEREQMRSLLNKVVSKEVAEEILKEPVHLGGEDRIVTMLFADIRNFSSLIAHFPPQKVVELLNGFMTKMTRVIEGEGGVIDKYMGDQIMALFGVPAFHPDHAIRALASAKLMIETLKKWNEEREKMGEPPVSIGIGIHTGLVVAGNMGTEDRLNYTVIGADVTLAARLCQVAKGGQILISEFTVSEPHVKESFELKELEPIMVKGYEKAVKPFEVVGFKWENGG